MAQSLLHTLKTWYISDTIWISIFHLLLFLICLSSTPSTAQASINISSLRHQDQDKHQSQDYDRNRQYEHSPMFSLRTIPEQTAVWAVQQMLQRDGRRYLQQQHHVFHHHHHHHHQNRPVSQLKGLSLTNRTFSAGRSNNNTRQRYRQYIFVKTLGPKYISSMNWRMQLQARNQMYEEQHWFEVETEKVDAIGDGKDNRGGLDSSTDEFPELGALDSHQYNVAVSSNSADEAIKIWAINIGPKGMDEQDGDLARESGPKDVTTDESVPTDYVASMSASEVVDDNEPGYFFFPQILDHFPASSSPPTVNSTFRQYYHISSEFYKPGGPIILWIPGESPLRTVFLRRGMAYELANATSGLLVALEHRFYGNSIPRFQDAHPAHQKDVRPGERIRQATSRVNSQIYDGFESRHGVGGGGTGVGRRGFWGATSVVQSNPRTHKTLEAYDTIRIKEDGMKNPGVESGGQGTGARRATQKSKDHQQSHDGADHYIQNDEEGLPLDLLKYLSVDQSIEDTIYFMDNFAALQPSLFKVTDSHPSSPSPAPTRWILAGCSYGGNLAAWTRQRYPSKVFAAFASSAPLRSSLDFYQYSTSQTHILGEQCSARLARARDFIDGALQTTDQFMNQMALWDKLDKDAAQSNPSEKPDGISLEDKITEASTDMASSTDSKQPPNQAATKLTSAATTCMNNNSTGYSCTEDIAATTKQAAKLRVLEWFSPDFAQDYALQGEEVHAAGWVWWTVASTVQYNSVVTAPTVEPAKTAIDVLCETIAQIPYDSVSVPSDTTHYHRHTQHHLDQHILQEQKKYLDLESLYYARALAAWFKDQQYFTPTKTEDLQPSDLDPNSAQNLASMAWLWQTCSELGYLQTSRPSSCCCSSLSTSPTASNSTRTAPGRDVDKDTTACRSVSGLSVPYSCVPNGEGERIDNATVRLTDEPRLPQTLPCLPCRCYVGNESPVVESVFSRLLTLEAAWQECRFYFGTSTSDSSNSPLQHPIAAENASQQTHTQQAAQQEAGNVFPINGKLSRSLLKPQPLLPSSQHRHQHQHQHQYHLHQQLLNGYPDVEKNVNNKFHGWEIVEEASSYSTSVMTRHEVESNTAEHFHPPEAKTSLDTNTGSDTISNSAASSSDPSKDMDRGRYYFTNGENDPWRELTLASAQALEFLKRRNIQVSDSKNAKSKQQQQQRPEKVQLPTTTPSSLEPPSLPVSAVSSSTADITFSHSPLPKNYHYRQHRLPYQVRQRGRKKRRSIDSGPAHSANAMHGFHDDLADEKDAADAYILKSELGANDRHDELDNDDDAEHDKDRNVIRIIPGASHCQDILYESSDLESAELREERQHVLKTFVRWIELDEKRQRHRASNFGTGHGLP